MNWPRWTGYRRDLLRAVDIAAEELTRWTGYNSLAAVDLSLDGGLSDDGRIELVETLSRDDLARLDTLSITVKANPERWERELEEAVMAGGDRPKPPAYFQVEFRIWRRSGLRIRVIGPSRAAVQGLGQSLRDATADGASGPISIALGPNAILLGIPLLTGGWILGLWIPRWLGLAAVNDRWEAWEIIGLVSGLALGALIPLTLWLAFPTTQLLDDGQLPRSQRLWKLVLAAVGIVIAAVVTLGIEAAIT